MTGCFGGSAEDRFHEAELDRYLDEEFDEEGEEDDELPSEGLDF
jgi:hypothetical protein